MRLLGPDDHVVVVGAGLAGWRLVEALRRDAYTGSITLIGDESYAPYDRPPLTKQVLSGKWPPEHTTLATAERIENSGVDMRLGASATGLDVDATTVYLGNATRVQGTHVVVATGARARRLALSADSATHTIRTRRDLEALDRDLSRLDAGSRVVVIGGGFIGAEAATSLRARGFAPIVLEALERPLLNVVGPEISSWLAGLAEAIGVELRVGQRIRDVVVDESAGGLRVLFEDGDGLAAPLVIEAVGVVPNDGWLASSGLAIDGGVVVDEHLLAGERVAALGDVARFTWRGPAGYERVRIEHWQNANDHALALARYWATGESTGPFVPYFWSDQYGKKIQMLGHPRPDDDVARVSGDDSKWVALLSRDGVVTGVVALGQPRALMLSRGLLVEPTFLDAAVAAAPWSS